MPRNRSERSVSGDPVLDEYLRAFIRSHTLPHGGQKSSSQELKLRHETLLRALTDRQHSTIRALGSDGRLTLGQTRELFRHEPELQNAP